MKKQANTNQRNLVTLNYKLLFCILFSVLSIFKSIGQESKLDSKLFGTWLIPVIVSSIENENFSYEQADVKKMSCYYQYTFKSDGSFQKELFVYGKSINVSEYTNKKTINGRWFTLNNGIYLTENSITKSMTYAINKERLTIKTDVQEIELLASY